MLQGAAQSGFKRLKIDDPVNREKAKEIVRRILAGADNDTPPEQGCRRECFIVQRSNDSKSQYQVQVGIVRMVVQKAA